MAVNFLEHFSQFNHFPTGFLVLFYFFVHLKDCCTATDTDRDMKLEYWSQDELSVSQFQAIKKL